MIWDSRDESITSEKKVLEAVAQAMGISPTTVAFAEVYGAMQTEMVDGMITSPAGTIQAGLPK